MVTPDDVRFVQDTKPGLVRELHRTIASQAVVYRNLQELDYGALVELPNVISTQCDAGYVLGVPYGRHIKTYFEFDNIDGMREELLGLVDDLGELAMQHTACEVMVLEFNDFANRHHIDPIIVGANFGDPVNFALMRCRDVRDQQLPDPPSGVSVRQAGEADGEKIAALEQRVRGADALGPPLPAGFIGDARWFALAEVDGEAVGYIRVLDADRRGLLTDEFVVDEEQDGEAVAGALLQAVFEHGRADDRRALTLRVPFESINNSLLASYGFKHAGDGLHYVRSADPAQVRREIDEKVQSHFKVGKIFGMFR